MKSIQDLSSIDTFLSDLKSFIAIFDLSHPKDALRPGNWILKDFIFEIESRFPVYDKKVIRYIGTKMVNERIRHMNKLQREKALKKRQAKKSEKSIESKFDSMSMRSKRKVKEFASN